MGAVRSPPDGLLAQQFLGDETRLLDRYKFAERLIETLSRTKDHRHLVPRVAACHHTFRHWRCDQNHDWAEAEHSCSVRVCPHDSRRRSLVLAGRMEKFLVAIDGLALCRVCGAEHGRSSAGNRFREAWTRLRRSVRWKKYVRGCIVAMEVTYNPEENTWHPHLNVLMQGEYFPFEELNQAWITATEGRGKTSFIRAADAGTVRELIKYVTKLSDLIGKPSALDEFLTAVFRRRLVRTYGTFYGLPVDDEENPGVCCPDCQSQNTIRLGYVPSHQISLDAKGILRAERPPWATASDLREAVQFNFHDVTRQPAA